MDLSVLNRLKTESLTQMQAHIVDILKSRLDTEPRYGRVGTFLDTRNGITRTVRIEGVNRKTVSATEMSPDAGRKWRVSYGSLKVEPIERKLAMPMKTPVVAHRPSTVGGSAW